MKTIVLLAALLFPVAANAQFYNQPSIMYGYTPQYTPYYYYCPYRGCGGYCGYGLQMELSNLNSQLQSMQFDMEMDRAMQRFQEAIK